MSPDTRQPGAAQPDGRVAQTEEHNFGPFSENPAYREENRELIRIVLPHLPQIFNHIDLAAGTGLVSRLTQEEIGQYGMKGRTIGIDPDRVALDIALSKVPTTQDHIAYFEEGTATEVPELMRKYFRNEKAHWFSIHDAIHEIDGDDAKMEVFETAYASLVDGGVMSVNSAFYRNAMADAGARYGKWGVMGALLVGERPIKPNIDVKGEEDYIAMAEASGFRVIHTETSRVILNRQAIEDISRYPAFIAGIFPHATNETIPKYSEALIQATEKLSLTELPRNWFRMLLQKPNAETKEQTLFQATQSPIDSN